MSVFIATCEDCVNTCCKMLKLAVCSRSVVSSDDDGDDDAGGGGCYVDRIDH